MYFYARCTETIRATVDAGGMRGAHSETVIQVNATLQRTTGGRHATNRRPNARGPGGAALVMRAAGVHSGGLAIGVAAERVGRGQRLRHRPIERGQLQRIVGAHWHSPVLPLAEPWLRNTAASRDLKLSQAPGA